MICGGNMMEEEHEEEERLAPGKAYRRRANAKAAIAPSTVTSATETTVTIALLRKYVA